jgi:hypothetical protein
MRPMGIPRPTAFLATNLNINILVIVMTEFTTLISGLSFAECPRWRDGWRLGHEGRKYPVAHRAKPTIGRNI